MATIEDPIIARFVNESIASFATLAIGGALQAQSVSVEYIGKAIASLAGADDTATMITGLEAQGFPSLTVSELKAVIGLANQLEQMATGQSNILPILYKAARQVPKLL